MSNEPLVQHVTVEIMGLAPKLRDDLRISVQVYAGQTCYLIEDPISSRFSRVGLAEYTLLSLLDGQTTIAESLGQTAAIMGPEALSESEAAGLCKWLIDSQLAETDQSRGAGRLAESADRSRRRKATARLNPIFQKVPLLNPQPLLNLFTPWLGWIFSTPAILIFLVVVGLGGYCVGTRWAQFTADSSVVIARENWIWLLFAWFTLKLVHESGHALACRRFGGTVREAGVMFVLLAPLPYVDVTSAWRFDSKWKRILTAAAGMYVELWVAAIAAILWSATDDPLCRQHARNVIVTATVVTVLFNLNPLMRFDGYYLLCDWLELPNLATHGRQLLSYFGRRHLLGATLQRPDWPEGQAATVAAYAVAALVWRAFIFAALILGAEALFWGAGVVLAMAAVVLWAVVPVLRLAAAFGKPGVVRRRRMAIAGSLIATALVGVYFLPFYWRLTAPVIVDYETVHELRSPVGGFVNRVLVDEGDFVAQGQLLAVLDNRELELDLQRLRIEIESSEARARKFREAHEIAAFQVETENGRALESRLLELRARLADLEVRAPISGTVTWAEVDQLRGTFVKPGERILSIGSEGAMRLHGLVAQEDAEVLNAGDSHQAEVHIWGSHPGWHAARFERVHPRATTKLVHPALGSACGGPLAVRARLDGHDHTDRWELIEPHVWVEARCPGRSHEFGSGQTGIVRLRYYRGAFGQVLLETVLRWVQHRREQALARW